MSQREQKKAVNANGFTSLNVGLRFDLNSDSINQICGNSMRGDCVDVWGDGGE